MCRSSARLEGGNAMELEASGYVCVLERMRCVCVCVRVRERVCARTCVQERLRDCVSGQIERGQSQHARS